MANKNLNPLSRLLDIQFPDIKRSNWNNSYDYATTASVGYVNVVHTDHIMAGTRAKLDFNSASFANSTIAPLYGRYKVKYLAVWAPDRLYMPDWLTGEKMMDDDYPYPFIKTSWSVTSPLDTSNFERGDFDEYSKSTAGYIPPTSLAHQLRYYPALTCSQAFDEEHNIPNRNAFAFLTYWDAFRTFIANPQDPNFYVRTRAFIPAIHRGAPGLLLDVIDAQEPVDKMNSISDLDSFFKIIKRADHPIDVIQEWKNIFRFDPIWSPRYVYRYGPDGAVPADGRYNNNKDAILIHHNYHYGLPVCTYKPDFFTSWVSNENVELEKTKSKVKVEGTLDGNKVNSEFTMEQWYLASRIQSKIRKNIYQFNDFAQWIDTNFGVKPPTTLTQPMFLGAFESDIIFNDVISQTQTGRASENNLGDNKDLGSRAGFGIGKNGNESNFFDFTAKEPGTVMVLQMIVPEVFYFECSDPLHNTLNFNEEFNPVFDALGFQDLGIADMNLVPNLVQDPDGGLVTGGRIYDLYNTAFAQQPYAMEHMSKINLLGGQMVEPTYYQNWTLARSFNYCRGRMDEKFWHSPDTTGRDLYSTYILPEMYQNIFASSPHVDNFQFYLSFNYTKYQPVGKQFLSFPVR